MRDKVGQSRTESRASLKVAAVDLGSVARAVSERPVFPPCQPLGPSSWGRVHQSRWPPAPHLGTPRTHLPHGATLAVV